MNSPQREAQTIIMSPLGKKVKKHWHQEEDALLEKLALQLHSNWKVISTYFPLRNPNQCAQRWKRIKPQEHERNRKWQLEEDQQLKDYYLKWGPKWNNIAKNMVNRSGRQIRERYLNHLDPQLSLNHWTQEEDDKLWELHQKLGTKWAKMSKVLLGRSENMIKNRFYNTVGPKYGKYCKPYLCKYSDGDSPLIEKKIIPPTTNSIENNQLHSGSNQDIQYNCKESPLLSEINIKQNEEEKQTQLKEEPDFNSKHVAYQNQCQKEFTIRCLQQQLYYHNNLCLQLNYNIQQILNQGYSTYKTC